MLEKVVTGGMTGADQAAWRAARACGIPTGGWMPAGFLTEAAGGKGVESHREFAVLYGARELPGADYPARTRANVRDSDATLWFGRSTTAGAWVTLAECRNLGRPTCLVPPGGSARPSDVARWLGDVAPRVLNVAGNRASTAPDIGPKVERFLVAVFRRLGRGIMA